MQRCRELSLQLHICLALLVRAAPAPPIHSHIPPGSVGFLTSSEFNLMHPLTSSVTSGRLRPCFLICRMRIITLVLPTSAWLLWILTTTVTEYFQEMEHYLNPKYQKGLPIPWRACIANTEALGQWDVTNGEVLEACSLLLSSVPNC